MKDSVQWLREQASAAAQLAKKTEDRDFARRYEADCFRYRHAAAELERCRQIIRELVAGQRGEEQVLHVDPATLRRAKAAITGSIEEFVA